MAYVAVAVSCAVLPVWVKVVTGAVSVSEVGTAVVFPIEIGGMPFIWLATMLKRDDWPEVVTPLFTQVARARTRPKPAGIFGSVQLPSVFTGVLRLRMLTKQF